MSLIKESERLTFSNNTKIIWFLIVTVTWFGDWGSTIASVQQAKKPFTVADEIGLTYFGGPEGLADVAQAVKFSPDGNYFAVGTERGRLDLNYLEDSLRFYRSQDINDFLGQSNQTKLPSPVWVVSRAGKQGPIIQDWRWLANSSGVAFLDRTEGVNLRLVLADLRRKEVEILSSATEIVEEFDIRDRRNYVYTAEYAAGREKLQKKLQSERAQTPAILGTGRSLEQLLLEDPRLVSSPRKYLRAVIDGKRSEVRNNGAPILFYDPPRGLALSPEGHSLVATLPIPEVPVSWEMLYPPPHASSPWRIRAGHLDVQTGNSPADQYVLINLSTGTVLPLTHAPLSRYPWAYANGGPSWSSDAQAILLPGTFLRSKENAPSPPCVGVVDLPSNTSTCVEFLKGRTETGAQEGFHFVKEAWFAGGDKRRIMVSFYNYSDQSIETTEYERRAESTWEVVGRIKGEPKSKIPFGLQVIVKRGLNVPPQLVAANKNVSRLIWDPNPQLRNIELGQVSVYTWKDKEGRDWRGGLFKPSDYKPGRRYPLVIQPYAFNESEFSTSGQEPTGFAARALAGAGIVVLQIRTSHQCPIGTSGSGACAVSGNEAAVKQLASDGLVDPERVGIIGFSQSCFYAMETLTTGSVHVKAASVTGCGALESYLQYILFITDYANITSEADSVIGAPPFGQGLQQWLTRSPGFNLDKITSPLLVATQGSANLLGMWEWYAGLRYLHKPVELVLFTVREHVFTNPAARMASQGGTVDWFRFWLQDYEDPDAAKKEQYVRWRDLRKLQEQNEAKSKQTNPAPPN